VGLALIFWENIMKYNLRIRLLAFIASSMLLFGSASVWAKDPIYTGIFSNLALSGYDSVAYFTENKPVKGKSAHSTQYKGAEWRFKSAEHLALFVVDPNKYAPQYGGYCAWAAAHNSASKGDPLAWTIYEDKLYLNYDKDIRVLWLADIVDKIAAADTIWPAPLL
jgi:YHS domain-containing protein